ncbi:MAG TPA: peptidoglycan-binding domain-containing protein [Streptosporangiaceae bacterium]|nr:peptidoglycan-binding domain-containing protein [Streptosporangiaceae bacterium]
MKRRDGRGHRRRAAGRVSADLAPGETGPDVAELQKALAALGYSDQGDLPGYYGVGTEDAVTAFYTHLGYAVPTSSTMATGGIGAGAGAGTACGPQVPQGDVLFLLSLPATVIAVYGAVGQQAASPFLELSAAGALTLTGELPPAYASRIKTGLKVKIYDETTGIRATGTVTAIGTATQTLPTGAIVDIGGAAPAAASSSASGSSGSSASSGGPGGSSGASLFVPLTITPSKPLPAALNGENVLVNVETGQTEGPPRSTSAPISCWTSPTPQQNSSLGGIQAMVQTVRARDVADQAVIKATRQWSACMLTNGYGRTDPNTLLHSELPVINSGGQSNATPSAAQNGTQIAAAEADAACTQSAGLAGIYFAVQAGYEQQIVDANTQQLSTAVQRYRAAYQKELADLPQLLTTASATLPGS